MKLINIKTRRGIVNLFADFIVKKINSNPEDKSVIQVTDCNNFYVINGVTTQKSINDLTKIKSDFIAEYSDIIPFDFTTINMIDLIKYDFDVKVPKQFTFTYFNSDRPIYNDLILRNQNPDVESICVSENQKIIYEVSDKFEKEFLKDVIYKHQEISVQSEFPHGYSLKCGRGLMYYFENIMHELKSGLICKYLTFNINTNNNISVDITTNSIFPNEDILSMIYDLFDFDLQSFYKKLDDYNICNDLIKPTEKKPWLENKIHPNDKLVF